MPQNLAEGLGVARDAALRTGASISQTAARDQAARLIPACVGLGDNSGELVRRAGDFDLPVRCRRWLFLRGAGGPVLLPPSPPVGPPSVAMIASFYAVRGPLSSPKCRYGLSKPVPKHRSRGSVARRAGVAGRCPLPSGPKGAIALGLGRRGTKAPVWVTRGTKAPWRWSQGQSPRTGTRASSPVSGREIQNGRAKATSLLASKQHASGALDGDTSMACKCYQNDILRVFRAYHGIRGHYWLIPATSDHYRWPRGPNLSPL